MSILKQNKNNTFNIIDTDKSIITFKDLYEFIQKYNGNNFITNWLEKPWQGKDKQESLLRLFTGLNLIDKLKNYDMCRGNFNLITIEKISNIRELFYDRNNNLINLKDKGSASDLTCISKSDNKNILVTTSKNINELTIGKLEIEKILAYFDQYKIYGYNMLLCICVRNLKSYIEMKNNMEETSRLLKSIINKPETIIIDWKDLDQSYNQFKLLYNNISFESIVNSNKPNLSLKLHQYYSVIKTIKLKNNKKDKVLWGHIQRSGKSYIIAGTIIYNNINNLYKKSCNYLIITTAPNETIEQQRKILDCVQLQNFNIIVLNGKNKKPELKDKNIIICSKQFLQTKINNLDKLENNLNENNLNISTEIKTENIKWLKDMKFEIRFIDETHNGGTTELAKKTLDYYGKNSFTVYITATYSKPINNYNISNDSWILWDLEDIRLCQNINVVKNTNRLIEKHGLEFKQAIENYSIKNIITEYNKYPELHLLTDILDEKIQEEIISQTKNNNYGWSPEACLLLKQGMSGLDNLENLENLDKTNNLDNTNKTNQINKKIYLEEFQNEKETLKLWYRIFGKKNNLGIPDSEFPDEKVFIKRIEKICKNPSINSRFIGEGKYFNEPMIIMTFLPSNNIYETSNAVEKLLTKYNVIPEYEIVCINSKKTGNPKDNIEDARIKAKHTNKKGVLVLSGRQCSLGISIDNCDIVILLNNNMSFDMIYQMMFRCMTEADDKKCGFVIDLNINRVIETTIVNYSSIIKPKLDTKKAVKYLFQERLINLNADHWMPIFGHRSSDIDNITNDVYKIFTSNTINALDFYLNRLKFKEVLLSKEDQIIFNTMFKGVEASSKQKKIIEDFLNNLEKLDNNEEIKNGIEKFKVELDSIENQNIENQNDQNDQNDQNKEKKKNNINYMDIFKHIVPLISLLTIHNQETSIVEMIKIIENNKLIYKILIDQTKSWWGKMINPNIIKFIFNVYIKNINGENSIHKMIIAIKELFIQNVNNAKQLSKLIDKYLIPQELEKKTNAEVSTPYILRKEMLDKTPNEFWTKQKKVFEPCSGKGGFIIDIIDRFMEGLKDEIKDAELRYKTIVEECLYFSDINSTNIFICKLLLDPYNKYKLNYNEGDTLKLDIKTKWNLDGFDAVIGNPPYQAPRIKENKKKGGGGDLIWNKFVFLSINILNKNGYLLYIHPAGWRKPEGLNVKTKSKYKGLYELLAIKNDLIYLNINDTSQGIKLFKCGTRFDYYLMQKKYSEFCETIIDDEENKIIKINLKKIPFIPNKNIILTSKIISMDINNNIEVLRPGGDPRREYISDIKNDIYKYVMVHSTPNECVRYKYCNIKKNSDHFNIPKIIFGETGITKNIVLDKNGEYGLTCCAFAIKFIDEKIFNIIKNKKFKLFIESCSWSNYRIDWRLFTYLKKDFWKEFI